MGTSELARHVGSGRDLDAYESDAIDERSAEDISVHGGSTTKESIYETYTNDGSSQDASPGEAHLDGDMDDSDEDRHNGQRKEDAIDRKDDDYVEAKD